MSETSTDLAIADTESHGEPALVREWIQELLERVPLLLLASECDPSILQLMLRNRSGGILETDASPEKIVQAIKSVASGLIVIDGVFGVQRSDEDPLAELLTPRETEVLRLLADGSGNKEIAAHLNISEHTIKFHIRSILGKLGASSRTEAVSRGLRHGLIEL